MEKIKLFDSELNVMEILWEKGALTAKEVSDIAYEKVGWNKNTTYTVIKKLIVKGAIKRSEPNFICEPLIKKKEIQFDETKALINKYFNGSLQKLFANFMQNEKLSKEDIESLKALIDDEDRE